MDSRRQNKVASLIKETFSEIISRDLKGAFGRAFITVTNVKVTSDLAVARFYLSIFNTDNKEAVLQQFEEKRFEIKRHLAEKLRFNLRKLPEMEFYIDDTLDQAYEMDALFKKIHEEVIEPVKEIKDIKEQSKKDK